MSCRFESQRAVRNPRLPELLPLAIVALAVALRLAWILLVPSLPSSDDAWYDQAARDLARTGALHYRTGTGQVFRAWFPPGWPAFLALWYGAFGPVRGLYRWVNLLLAGLAVWLTYRLGERALGRGAALLGALLYALLPGQIVYVGLPQYEVFVTVLLLAVLCLLPEGKWPWRSPRAHAAGALLAWAVLARPPLALLPGAFALERSYRRGALLLALYVAAASGAWCLRNWAVLGVPVLYSTNGGYNLWHGSNPNATGGAFVPPDSPDARLNLPVITDEVERNRTGYRYALEWIRDHPRRFLALIPARLFHFYGSDTTGVYLTYLAPVKFEYETWLTRIRSMPWLESLAFRTYAVVMLLALVGMILAPWRSPEVRIVGLVILYSSLVVCVTFGQNRYHAPLMPLFCLFAGYGLASLVDCRAAYRRSCWTRVRKPPTSGAEETSPPSS